MGTISENKKLWTDYDGKSKATNGQSRGEQPKSCGGTIRPGINAFVPMDTILEIAPGVGGCTRSRSLQRGSVGRDIGCILIRVCPAFWRTMKGMLPQGRFSVTGREVFGRTWNRERRDLVGY